MVPDVPGVLPRICGHQDEEADPALHHEPQQIPSLPVPHPLPRAAQRQNHRVCRQRVCPEGIRRTAQQVSLHTLT